ncbi:MAG: hypothetical protein JKY54_10650 [Flavobacteriales bacterium]|nr:hypothetical protein [Flavobacteriales bacterium]
MNFIWQPILFGTLILSACSIDHSKENIVEEGHFNTNSANEVQGAFGNENVRKDSLSGEWLYTFTSQKEYFDEVLEQSNLIISENFNPDAIADSLFSSNQKQQSYFFSVFTKSMTGADGSYSELVGLSSLKFLLDSPDKFAHYFATNPTLDVLDLSNWARFISSELEISGENQEVVCDQIQAQKLANEKEKEMINKLIQLIKQESVIINSKYDLTNLFGTWGFDNSLTDTAFSISTDGMKIYSHNPDQYYVLPFRLKVDTLEIFQFIARESSIGIISKLTKNQLTIRFLNGGNHISTYVKRNQ